MAEEARISGINWRETFPFTNLFRSFRIAIHPSKLGLGLIALLCLYLGGRFFDWVWPTPYRAVPDEVALYQDYGTVGGSGAEFRNQRAARRQDIDTKYASLLIDLGIMTDRKAAEDTAHRGKRTDEATDRILKRRDDDVAAANRAYDRAIADAAKEPNADQRERAENNARRERDDSIGEAYTRAAQSLDVVRDAKGNGLFRELFEYETSQINRVVNGVMTFNWLGGLRKDTSPGVVRSIINFFAVGPLWLMWHHTVFFIIFGLLFLTVWAIFGGAIARIAAVHVARDEKLSLRAALSFSAAKFLSFVSAPLIPIIIILLVGLIPLIAGLLSSIPYLGPIFYILMGALFIVLLAAGFVMTLVLIGLVAGLNLMYPTIAVEGSDSCGIL